LSEDTTRVYSEYGFHLFWTFRLKEAIEIFDLVIGYKSEKLTNDLYVEDGVAVYDRKKWLDYKRQQNMKMASTAMPTMITTKARAKTRMTRMTRSSDSNVDHHTYSSTKMSSNFFSRRSTCTSKRIAGFFQSLWNLKKEQENKKKNIDKERDMNNNNKKIHHNDSNNRKEINKKKKC